jgi:xanthine dehydrogenase YagS FAD-binding subunit
MATVAGNLLQRTRCPHFRADVALPCNQRRPGSGCSERDDDRAMAVLGADEHCVATHPSDLAVALTALDARVRIGSAAGTRELDVVDLLAPSPGRTGEHTTLRPGELVTAIVVPGGPGAATSTYVKVRERASFEFALVSAAASVAMSGDRISAARIALGGVAARPWPLTGAAERLVGAGLTEAELRRAIEPDLAGARPRPGTASKPEFAVRAAIRAVQRAGAHR